MIRFSWFRLILRVFGVVIIGIALPGLSEAVVRIGHFAAHPDQWAEFDPWWIALSHLPVFVQTTFGLYLLFGGKWLVERCLRGIDSICPSCAYDLSGAAGDTCPECGFHFRPFPRQETPKAPAQP